ncbi:MAG: prepilin-type N-terminal cleavage/methylation domain-containing protein [Candidatus Gracilibacteria bacterium]|nr:prepilin-type N-terminal cleavage/methylation domain-containing protein [Candidatus Gracilibacteria bacterium]
MQEKNNYVETYCNTSLRNNKKAYTFIELMVVITIIAMITIMTYVPYNFYSNKEKVRITAKEVSQSLGEARNMAINGLSNSNSNVQIGLYFDKNAGNKIRYLSYPYDFSGTYITNEDISQNIRLIKDKTLADSVNITSVNDKENILFIFKSITGDLELKTSNAGTFQTYTSGKLDINFGFKGASSGPLTKTVKYNTKTFITDY